jgi:hypothetical protein
LSISQTVAIKISNFWHKINVNRLKHGRNYIGPTYRYGIEVIIRKYGSGITTTFDVKCSTSRILKREMEELKINRDNPIVKSFADIIENYRNME